MPPKTLIKSIKPRTQPRPQTTKTQKVKTTTQSKTTTIPTTPSYITQPKPKQIQKSSSSNVGVVVFGIVAVIITRKSLYYLDNNSQVCQSAIASSAFTSDKHFEQAGFTRLLKP